MTPIAALYVQKGGAYYGLEGVDPWDEERDARLYDGPHPVVAHPPCGPWVNFAALNWGRHRRQRPAWYPGGSDGGCFAHALRVVRRFGGVLEHPAETHAWAAFGLPVPYRGGGWLLSLFGDWVCEVWQSAYGHRAQKRTWLLYRGDTPPSELDWRQPEGEAQVGWQFVGKGCRGEPARKPPLGKLAAAATPPAFRDALINIARGARE